MTRHDSDNAINIQTSQYPDVHAQSQTVAYYNNKTNNYIATGLGDNTRFSSWSDQLLNRVLPAWSGDRPGQTSWAVIYVSTCME